MERGINLSILDLYGSFSSKLGLSAEEGQYFESLLSERLLAQQQLGADYLKAETSNRQQIIEEFENGMTQNDLKIRQFLNHPDDYADFIKCEQQHPERQNLAFVRPMLFDLTSKAEERFIDIAYQCRLEIEGERALWQTILPIGNLQQKQEYWQRCDEKLAQLLPSLFSENQAENFLEYWRVAREKQKEQFLVSFELYHGKG